MVHQAEGRWDNPSPCAEWDARAVVEHVIGFHDVLLLRPMGTKPSRPRHDPKARWAVTVSAILATLDQPSPHRPTTTGDVSPPDLGRLLPMLTLDVLVHSWDLARAVGVEPQLDPELCRIAYQAVRSNDQRLRNSGMFGPAVSVADDADPATLLVSFLGLDPAWKSSDHA